MAKSKETFTKREREKQRMRKQQDKLEKKQQRKSNKEKGKSLEDMMAYLDENGNLTDRPIDPRKKRVFRQDEIPVSVPKQEDLQPDVRRSGRVAFYNDHKGFGFINDAEIGERIFFHVKELSGPIKENDKVTFNVQQGHKGLEALNVIVVTS